MKGRKLFRKIPIILLIFMFTLFIVKNASGIMITLRGSNFDIYSPSNEDFDFQHLAIPLVVDAFTVSFHVNSGTLNGTDGEIEMAYSQGELSFLSQDSTVLSSSTCAIFVNGERSQNGVIVNGDNVLIKWSAPTGSWYPLSTLMGLIGIILFILGPTITVYEVKVKKNYRFLITALILLAIAYGLIVCWLSV